MLSDILWTDLETFSAIDLRKCGSYRYAENCEILLMSYAYDNEGVQVVDFTNPDSEQQFYTDYLLRLNECRMIGAHNGILFDRIVLDRSLLSCYFKGKRWYDTMLHAYTHSLPGSLGELSAIFNLSDDKAKIKEGRELVHLFCKPRPTMKIQRATRETHPEKWQKFIEYAGRDIVAMREINAKMPQWNISATELEYQMMDRRMNDRGFAVDTQFARGAILALEESKKSRDNLVSDMTDGDVTAATQRDKLLKRILETYGIDLPNLQQSTVERRIADPDIPEPVKDLLRLRSESAGTSTKKFQRILDCVCADGRLHGTMQHRGAFRTGRQGGRLFQPQNLPRPPKHLSYNAIATGIEAVKNGCIDLIYSSPVEICSAGLRGVIIAPEGKKLVVSDLSSIEGRMLAWLAGEEWKLQAYRDNDSGIGHDMYELTYASTFGVNADDVTPDERKLGKVLELVMGYQGGVGAFLAFAAAYGVDLDALARGLRDRLDEGARREAKNYYDFAVKTGRTHDLPEETFVACDAIKRMWRSANPNITRFWQDLESAVRRAYSGKESVILNSLVIDRRGSWLRVRLPSGRYLGYPGIKVEEKIRYLGQNIYSKKWQRVYTYGGKLAENITQAASNDYFFAGVLRAEKEGYLPVLLVHDEVVTEVPDSSEFTTQKLNELLSINPPWAADFPGNAKGFEAKRYRKD